MPDEIQDPRALRQAQFFMDLIKSGEVWPEDEWDKAREAYEGDAKTPQRVNLWRSTIDTSLAFQLQTDPTIRISPAEGFEDDERSKGRAGCDEALIKYLWREMGFGPERLRVIREGRIIGLGFARCCMDLRRMLPGIRHMDPEQVRIDPNCRGNIAEAQWVGFCEYVSPDLLVKDHPGLDVDKLRKASEPASGPKDDPDATKEQAEQISKSRGAVGAHLRRVRLWRLFLRNAAALYDKEPVGEKDEEAGPHLERFRDKEGLTEPRRYVELVEGYDCPAIVDEDAWPEALALDYDSWPVKRLAFNEAHHRTAGFTDHRHTKKVEEYLETVTGSGNRSMALKNCGAIGVVQGDLRSESELKKLLEQEGLKIVKNALGPDGKPLMALLFQDAGLSPEDVSWAELLMNWHDLISGVPKIRQGSEPETGVTATASDIASEATNARNEAQLRLIEEFDAEVVEQIQAMAHVNLRQLSSVEVVVPEQTVEVADPMTGMPVYDPTTFLPMTQTTPAHPEVMDNLPWAVASQILTEQPDAQLVSLGVEAMVGPELAQFWTDGEPLSVVRRSTQVTIERGSTQRRTREKKVLLALEMFKTVLAPIYEKTGRVDLLVKFATLLFDMQGLKTDFGAALPDPQEIMAQMQMQQQAQAAQVQQQQAVEQQDKQFDQGVQVAELAQQAQPVGAQ